MTSQSLQAASIFAKSLPANLAGTCSATSKQITDPLVLIVIGLVISCSSIFLQAGCCGGEPSNPVHFLNPFFSSSPR